MFSFIIENPPPEQHELEGYVIRYETGSGHATNTSLDFLKTPLNAPLKYEDTLETGYACSRWPSKIENRTILELMCRVDHNHLPNVSKVIFHLIYSLLEEKFTEFERSVVVSFNQVDNLNSTRTEAISHNSKIIQYSSTSQNTPTDSGQLSVSGSYSVLTIGLFLLAFFR